MLEPRPIPRKVIAGGLLLGGALIALIVMRAKNEPLVIPADASAPVREDAPTQPAVPSRPADPAAPATVPSGTPAPVDLGPAMLEARKLDDARVALAKNDPKAALAALDSYERVVRGPGALRHEATVLRVEALVKVGRKVDARALAMSVRDDSAWADDQPRLDAILEDAGLN